MNSPDASSLPTLDLLERLCQEMQVLFTFLAERYERRSVLISSNLVFSKWDQIFKDPMTTMAAIDRLVHHATILDFNGPSLRAQKAEGRQRSQASRPQSPSVTLRPCRLTAPRTPFHRRGTSPTPEQE